MDFGIDIAKTVGGIASGIFNNATSISSQQRQQRYTYDLINYQNEYNDPKNLMARLSNAGLNPNLAITGTAPSATSATATGAGGSPGKMNLQMSNAQYQNMLEQNANLREQNKLLDAQVKKTQAETLGVMSATKRTDADTAYFDKRNALADAQILSQIAAGNFSNARANEITQGLPERLHILKNEANYAPLLSFLTADKARYDTDRAGYDSYIRMLETIYAREQFNRYQDTGMLPENYARETAEGQVVAYLAAALKHVDENKRASLLSQLESFFKGKRHE